MKKVLILSFSDIEFDARVTRQISWLKETSEVVCVCFKANPNIKNVTWIPIDQKKMNIRVKALLALSLIFRLYNISYRLQHGYLNQLDKLIGKEFDWIIANDIESLPLAFQLKNSRRTRILFDAHEYAPRHFEDKLWWRLLFAPWHHRLCAQYIPKLDKMTTVSNGLVKEYEQNFGITPYLLTNATKFFDLEPTEVGHPIKIIHHGIVNRSRKIENMLEVARKLGKDYELDLILMLPEYASESTKHYFIQLQEIIESLDNVRLLPPMSNKDIVPFINSYDIGIFLLEPVNFNYTHALPNKLFDFIQARLAIAIGPSVEMSYYVSKHNLGVVSSTFNSSDLAKAITKLSKKQIFEYKSNCHNLASALSEEKNKDLLLSLIS